MAHMDEIFDDQGFRERYWCFSAHILRLKVYV